VITTLQAIDAKALARMEIVNQRTDLPQALKVFCTRLEAAYLLIEHLHPELVLPHHLRPPGSYLTRAKETEERISNYLTTSPTISATSNAWGLVIDDWNSRETTPKSAITKNQKANFGRR